MLGWQKVLGLNLLLIGACTRPNPSVIGHPTAVPFTACQAQSDCGAAELCTSLGCCPSCHSDSDCSGGSCVRSSAGGYCTPPGGKPTTPMTGNVPKPHARCASDADCAKEELCSVGVCFAKCSADSCAAGQTCVAGRCYLGDGKSCGTDTLALCSSDNECGASRACRSGSCHAACNAESGCPVGQRCNSGVCVDEAKPAHAQCVFDVDCGAAYRCLNAACHPLCATDGQCGAKSFCDQGVCRADVRPI